MRAIREQVAGALDLIIQQARLKDGSRRITAITEVVGMEGEVITLQDLFTFDYSAGRDDAGRFRGQLVSTGLRPKFTQDLADLGVELHRRCSLRCPMTMRFSRLAGAQGRVLVPVSRCPRCFWEHPALPRRRSTRPSATCGPATRRCEGTLILRTDDAAASTLSRSREPSAGRPPRSR